MGRMLSTNYQSVCLSACLSTFRMSLCVRVHLNCVLHRNNSYHQLGQTDRTDTVVPKVIEDIVPMSAVACGSNHCLSLDSQQSQDHPSIDLLVNHFCLLWTDMGHVYMWGYGKALGRSRDVAQPRRINLP